ncbi:MAG: hypothetical protein HDS41_04785 [Bacteroides sp.]|nr:hypothetical protein [Bacteroides sp.]
MKLKSIFAIALIAAVGTACNPATVFGKLKGEKPSETRVNQTHSFENIMGIDSSRGIIVHYTQQPTTEPVRIEGPENVVAELEIKLDKKGILDLSMKSGKNFRYNSAEDHVQVWVKAPAVTSFKASSGSLISVEEPIVSAASIKIKVSSGADIRMKSLTAGTATITTSSGANIDLHALTADVAILKSSSGANLDIDSVAISDALTAEASSGAVVEMASGTAAKGYFNASSGASVRAGKVTAQSGECKASSGGSIKSSIKNATVKQSSGGGVTNNN